MAEPLDNLWMSLLSQKPQQKNVPAPLALPTDQPDPYAVAISKLGGPGREAADALGIPEDPLGAYAATSPQSFSYSYNTKKIDDMRKLYQGKVQEALDQEREGIAKTKQALDDYMKKPTDIDWSPLIAYVDSSTGSNLAPGYKRPESAGEKAANVRKMEGELQGQRQKLTGAEIDAMRADLNNAVMGEQMKGQAALARAQQSDKNRSWRVFDAYQKDIFNKVEKDFADDAQNLDAIDSALAMNNYQAFLSALGPYARTVNTERGVLTDTDLARIVPRNWRGDWTKIKTYFGGPVPTSDLPDDYATVMRELVAKAKMRVAKKAQEKLAAREKAFRAHPEGRYLFDQGGAGTVIGNELRQRFNSLKAGQAEDPTDKYRQLLKGN